MQLPEDFLQRLKVWTPDVEGDGGFSEAPDPEREPVLRAIWERFEDRAATTVTPTLTTVEMPAPVHDLLAAGGVRKSARGRLAVSPSRGTSRNWSGGVLQPTQGRRFRRVGGIWRAPTVTEGAAGDRNAYDRPGLVGHGDAMTPRCSIWVGLDGYRGWASSMPQLGSEHVVGGEGRLWLQWWHPESRHFQVYLDDPSLIVAPGDEVACYLEIDEDGTKARFRFLKAAAGGSTVVSAIVMTAEPGRPALGSTAQAILERPSSPYVEVADDGGGGHERKAMTAGIYPMPDFGTVDFSTVAASSRSAWQPPTESDGRRMLLLANVAKRSDPTRTAIIARAKVRPEGGLRVAYTG